MIYLFLDEHYPAGCGHYPIRIGCVAVPQDRFNAWWRSLSTTSGGLSAFRCLRTSADGTLRACLDRTGAFVLLAEATATGFPASGLRIEFREGGGVAVSNAIWQHTVGQTICAALTRTRDLRWGDLTADVFLDRQDRNDPEREAEISILKGLCRGQSRARAGQRFAVRRVEMIEKDPAPERQKFAFGTRLAHWSLKLPGLKAHERCFEVDLSSALTLAFEALDDGSAGRRLRAKGLRPLLVETPIREVPHPPIGAERRTREVG